MQHLLYQITNIAVSGTVIEDVTDYVRDKISNTHSTLALLLRWNTTKKHSLFDGQFSVQFTDTFMADIRFWPPCMQSKIWPGPTSVRESRYRPGREVIVAVYSSWFAWTSNVSVSGLFSASALRAACRINTWPPTAGHTPCFHRKKQGCHLFRGKIQRWTSLEIQRQGTAESQGGEKVAGKRRKTS